MKIKDGEILGTIYTSVSDDFQRGLCPIARCIKASNADLAVVMKEVGFIDNGTGKHQSNTVYSTDGNSPSITTIQGGTQQIKILDRQIKDVKVIGQMDNTQDHTFESANRIYDAEGVSPTMVTCGGGGLQPKILVESKAIRMTRTEEGKRLRKDYESGKVHHGFNEHRKQELRQDGLSNTITTVEKDTLLCEKRIVAMRGRNPDNPSGNGQNGSVINSDGLARTVTIEKGEGQKIITDKGAVTLIGKDGTPATEQEVGEFIESCTATRYRIRKITPLEAYRLMGVSDVDARKMLAVNSNSQCYKQAGNSIVVPVLMAIMSQMNIKGVKPWNEMEECEIREMIGQCR